MLQQKQRMDVQSRRNESTERGKRKERRSCQARDDQVVNVLAFQNESHEFESFHCRSTYHLAWQPPPEKDVHCGLNDGGRER